MGGDRGGPACHPDCRGTAAVDVIRGLRPRCPQVFAQLAGQIHAVLPAAHAEHIGSTSVAGLGGRRVIDAVVIAAGDELATTTDALLDAGFTRSPHAWIEPTLTTVLQVGETRSPVLLYVLAAEHPVLRGWLASRDHWRADPEEAGRYAQVKQAALAAGHVQPWAYQQAKTPYLEELAQRSHLKHGTTP